MASENFFSGASQVYVLPSNIPQVDTLPSTSIYPGGTIVYYRPENRLMELSSGSWVSSDLRIADLVISDGGTIGSVTDADAMSIAANGNVSFTQDVSVSGSFSAGTFTTTNLSVTTLTASSTVSATGNITSSGTVSGASISTAGAVSAGSVSTGGSVSAGSVAATGAVSAASVAATGAVSAGSVSATGTISGSSIAVTGAITGASLTTTGVGTVSSLVVNENGTFGSPTATNALIVQTGNIIVSNDLIVNQDVVSNNLKVQNGGNIGSFSDPDAIAIASTGDVTLTQDLSVSGSVTANSVTATTGVSGSTLTATGSISGASITTTGVGTVSSLVINDAGTIGSTSDTDAITISSGGLVTFSAGTSGVTPQDESFIIACSDETTDLTTGTAKATFRMPYAFTVSAVRASVTTAPVGSTIVVDINEAGSSILSTKISIDASEKTSATAAIPPVISDTALADDAEITIDIDQVGSSTAGTGLKVMIIGKQT